MGSAGKRTNCIWCSEVDTCGGSLDGVQPERKARESHTLDIDGLIVGNSGELPILSVLVLTLMRQVQDSVKTHLQLYLIPKLM